jgi:hypothetical protein
LDINWVNFHQQERTEAIPVKMIRLLRGSS